MTGFAARSGEVAGTQWSFEIRGVNGRGFDLRLRLPEGLDDLERHLRQQAGRLLKRGNVTVTLRLQARTGAVADDPAALERALDAVQVVMRRAAERGLVLPAPSPAEILSLRLADAGESDATDREALVAALKAEADLLLADFAAARAAEGRALAGIITGQIDAIAALSAAARDLLPARRQRMADQLRRNLARVLDNSDGADPDRVAQELALIAVKADVTEEIDRLDAHVAAARDLLAAEGPVGRKLDFLTQEFNREANTLCSKANDAELTRIGLDLKTVIDQMREQVQNVE